MSPRLLFYGVNINKHKVVQIVKRELIYGKMGEPNNFPVFKKATLEDNSIGNKKSAWKSLKQILAVERTLQWPDNAVTCKLHTLKLFS